MVEIIGRATWGARFPDGTGPASLPASEVWLHHSVTGSPPELGTQAQDCAAVRVLENVGQQRFGAGVSYTFLVPLSGRVFEGHSVGRVGTHTKGRNSISRAICLIGNYDEVPPTGRQLTAVGELLRLGAHAGWWARSVLDGGHRDVPGASTACPGQYAHAAIPRINHLAGRELGLYTSAEALPRLEYRQRTEAVYRWQLWLTRMFPSYARFAPTGYYGDQTVAAVAEFQRRVGITGSDADGTVVGPRTNAAAFGLGYRG